MREHVDAGGNRDPDALVVGGMREYEPSASMGLLRRGARDVARHVGHLALALRRRDKELRRVRSAIEIGAHRRERLVDSRGLGQVLEDFRRQIADVERDAVLRIDRNPRRQDARTGHFAALDPSAQRERVVELRGRVHHCREAVTRQHARQVLGEPFGRLLCGILELRLGEMDVAVLEPRHDHAAGAGGGVSRCFGNRDTSAYADGKNLSVAHDYYAFVYRCVVGRWIDADGADELSIVRGSKHRRLRARGQRHGRNYDHQ